VFFIVQARSGARESDGQDDDNYDRHRDDQIDKPLPEGCPRPAHPEARFHRTALAGLLVVIDQLDERVLRHVPRDGGCDDEKQRQTGEPHAEGDDARDDTRRHDTL